MECEVQVDKNSGSDESSAMNSADGEVSSNSIDANGTAEANEEGGTVENHPDKSESIQVRTSYPSDELKTSRDLQLASADAALTEVSVMGFTLQAKKYPNTVLFRTQHLASLIQHVLKLTCPIYDIRGVRKKKQRARETQIFRKRFVSWCALATAVHGRILDQAVRDAIAAAHAPSDKAKDDRVGPFAKDCIRVAGVDVGFGVYKGKVFFELLGCFTLLGELTVAIRGRWEDVDAILLKQGMKRKEAFCRSGKALSRGQRSHISLSAVLVLARNGFVQCPNRRKTLIAIFEDIADKMNETERKKNYLMAELDKARVSLQVQQDASKTVDATISAANIKTEKPKRRLSSASNSSSNNCCDQDHVVMLIGQEVHYLVRSDKIFLLRWDVTALIGGSGQTIDFRKADRLLKAKDLDPASHYVFDNLSGAGLHLKSRRAHISLEALLILVKEDMFGPRPDLLADLEEASAKAEELKAECTGIAIASAGNSSSKSEHLAASSPIKSEDDDSDAAVNYILGHPVKTCIRCNGLFVSLKDFSGLLSKEDRSVQKLKKKVRTLRMRHSFFHPMARSGQKDSPYASANVLLALLEGGHLKAPNCDVLLAELRLVRTKLERAEDKQQPLVDNSGKKAYKRKVEEHFGDGSAPKVRLLENDVICQVTDGHVFLNTRQVFQLFPAPRTFSAVDDMLKVSDVPLEGAFLFEGRKRAFISTRALKAVVTGVSAMDAKQKSILTSRICELEEEVERLKNVSVLSLGGSFGDVHFRVAKNGKVFLRTLDFLSAAGFSQAYLDNSHNKAYCTVCRLLSQRGVNLQSCFLKQGKSKYVFISLHAAYTLMRTDFGPFKAKERTSRLRHELVSALRDRQLESLDEDEEDKTDVKLESESSADFDRDVISLSPTFGQAQRVQYVLKDGQVFLHRKTCFEALKLEQKLLTSSKGFAPVMEALGRLRLDADRCFMATTCGGHEVYEFMSLAALVALLESKDPLLVCLERKIAFLSTLLLAVQKGVRAELSRDGYFFVALKTCGELLACSAADGADDGRIFLDRKACFFLAGIDQEVSSFNVSDEDLSARGLNKDSCFRSGNDLEGEDAFVCLDILLLILTEAAGGRTKATTWKNIISAIVSETPTLRKSLKLNAFKKDLVASLMELYHRHLERLGRGAGDLEETILRPPKRESVSVEGEETPPEEKRDAGETHLEKAIESSEPMSDENALELIEDSSTSSLLAPSSSTLSLLFSTVRQSVLSSTSSSSSGGRVSGRASVGDWQVVSCDRSLVRLQHASSRKMSFLRPDVSALLRYELSLRPNAAQLRINDAPVPDDVTMEVIESSAAKGVFNLLFHMLTLRPCFGNFQPELVETIEKGDSSAWLSRGVRVDKAFVGTSQSGRVYSGTVRSTACAVLAQFRVGDTCKACGDGLKNIRINRSVLPLTACQSDAGVPMSGLQTSVWKMTETSAESCTFVCPQVQSFNTLHPSSAADVVAAAQMLQATTVVEHKVIMSTDLRVSTLLNGRAVAKSFPAFAKDLQMGPLLDAVASLRLCCGFPSEALVSEARFLVANLAELYDDDEADARRLFAHVVVDEDFEAELRGGVLVRGTVRSKECAVLAEDAQDICRNCRLLLEPIDLVGH